MNNSFDPSLPRDFLMNSIYTLNYNVRGNYGKDKAYFLCVRHMPAPSLLNL